MVTHMKTTVEIPDALAKAAREAASREGTTMRALIEEGLRAESGFSRFPSLATRNPLVS
jgi:hypothetical protein